MRITERHALRSYIDDNAIDRLVDIIADGADRLHAVIDAASPLLLPVPQAARLTAALGQVACWAATNSASDAEPAAALIETAATAVTEWAMAIERAGTDQVALISADTAVRTRHALETFRRQTRHWHLDHAATARRGRPRPARRYRQRPAPTGMTSRYRGH